MGSKSMFKLRFVSHSEINDAFVNSRDFVPSTKEIVNLKRTNLFIVVKVIDKEKFQQANMEQEDFNGEHFLKHYIKYLKRPRYRRLNLKCLKRKHLTNLPTESKQSSIIRNVAVRSKY